MSQFEQSGGNTMPASFRLAKLAERCGLEATDGLGLFVVRTAVCGEWDLTLGACFGLTRATTALA